MLFVITNTRKWPVSREKCRFLSPFELNRRSVGTVHQSQKLLGTTSKISANFSLCLRFIASIVFDLLCSQHLDKLYFFMFTSIEILLAEIVRPLRKPDIV